METRRLPGWQSRNRVEYRKARSNSQRRRGYRKHIVSRLTHIQIAENHHRDEYRMVKRVVDRGSWFSINKLSMYVPKFSGHFDGL